MWKEAFKHLPAVLMADFIIILINGVTQSIYHKSIEEGAIAALQMKVPFWLLISIASALYLLFRVFFNIHFIRKSKLLSNELASDVLFDSDYSSYYDYEFLKEKLWDPGSRLAIGKRAEASIQFDYGFINVERKNTGGRLIFKIGKYRKNKDAVKSYIEKDAQKVSRNIEVTFETKLIGKPLDLRIVFVRNNAYDWLSSDTRRVESREWQREIVRAKLPSNEDFTIRFEDSNCGGLPCNYQIRKIVIKEV
jgi:hypothetical protein